MSDSEEIVTRAYSLTGPAFVHDRKTYSISVRHQKATDEKGEYVEGIMSSYINTHLQIGKDVELTPPGEFHCPAQCRPACRNICWRYWNYSIHFLSGVY
jgi:ferredoxin-NADP reductase